MTANDGLGWELQWHRAGGEIVRLAASRRLARGLAAALVAAAAVAVGGGLASGLERIGTRRVLASVVAENRALTGRREALRERLQRLGVQVEARGSGGEEFPDPPPATPGGSAEQE